MAAVLEQAFQYLFDTGLRYNGSFRVLETANDSAQSNESLKEVKSELDIFMEQTTYMACITRNTNKTWMLDCEQSNLLHPNGKLLI